MAKNQNKEAQANAAAADAPAAAPAAAPSAKFALTKPIEEMTIEEMELATRRIALQTAMLQLDEVEEANRKRIEKREAVRRFNEQLQQDVVAEQRGLERGQKVCRHRSGGFPSNIFRGNREPCVFRTRMLDGYTYLIQCLRCRLKVFTPHPSLERKDPKEYAKQQKLYEKMWELSEERAMDEIRTPSFSFRKNGVEFVPERV